ncbi:precorrin-8X methylmutase [Salmonella enterica subsp. enterica]|uniref:Precorrin-8X methylmutase n=1 Tax=Salmonella enterica I TaxID=59201 RepID=A0A3S4LUU4_SALET|nr:precorrin-8X methylmutase [Salmonella enterica subsp. enterica]
MKANSFTIISDIIRETRPDYRFASPLHEAIIKRVIHTTADFDWLDILWFSADALEQLCDALRQPGIIYTDTTMALSGINKRLLATFWRRVSLLYQRSARGARRKNAGDYPLNGRRRYRYRRGGEKQALCFR